MNWSSTLFLSIHTIQCTASTHGYYILKCTVKNGLSLSIDQNCLSISFYIFLYMPYIISSFFWPYLHTYDYCLYYYYYYYYTNLCIFFLQNAIVKMNKKKQERNNKIESQDDVSEYSICKWWIRSGWLNDVCKKREREKKKPRWIQHPQGYILKLQVYIFSISFFILSVVRVHVYDESFDGNNNFFPYMNSLMDWQRGIETLVTV